MFLIELPAEEATGPERGVATSRPSAGDYKKRLLYAPLHK